MRILWYQPDDLNYCKAIERNLQDRFLSVDVKYCSSIESLINGLRTHNTVDTFIILQIHDENTASLLWNIKTLFSDYYTIVLFDADNRLNTSDFWFIETKFVAPSTAITKNILISILNNFGKTRFPEKLISAESVIKDKPNQT